MAKFVCSVCGYTHEGNEAPGRCPVCKSPSSQFTLHDDVDKDDAQNLEHVVNVKNTLGNGEIIQEKGYDIESFNTICNATEERQSEAADIASNVDVMLVIGGKNSSNSRKLYQLCREICPRTFFLQSAEGLDLSTFQGKDCVGITAGASTPNYIIEEVQKKCQRK